MTTTESLTILDLADTPASEKSKAVLLFLGRIPELTEEELRLVTERCEREIEARGRKP